jgi:hypothetical protein
MPKSDTPPLIKHSPEKVSGSSSNGGGKQPSLVKHTPDKASGKGTPEKQPSLIKHK